MTSLFVDVYCVQNPPKKRCAVVGSLTPAQKKYHKTRSPLYQKCYETYRSSVSLIKRCAVEFVENKRFERTAITQEDAAGIVANGFPSSMIGSNYPEESYVMDGLYHSVSAMVFKLCRKYTATCTTELNDLAHECLRRIFAKIHQFDRLKGKFTTWTYRVCSTVLARIYQNDKKRKSRFADEGEDEEQNERIRNRDVRQQGVTVLNAEMREVIRGLSEEYPEKIEFIVELFGNINDKNHLFPVSVCISDSARKTGIEYVEAYAFFKRVVRPIFKDYFNSEVTHV